MRPRIARTTSISASTCWRTVPVAGSSTVKRSRCEPGRCGVKRNSAPSAGTPCAGSISAWPREVARAVSGERGGGPRVTGPWARLGGRYGRARPGRVRRREGSAGRGPRSRRGGHRGVGSRVAVRAGYRGRRAGSAVRRPLSTRACPAGGGVAAGQFVRRLAVRDGPASARSTQASPASSPIPWSTWRISAAHSLFRKRWAGSGARTRAWSRPARAGSPPRRAPKPPRSRSASRRRSPARPSRSFRPPRPRRPSRPYGPGSARGDAVSMPSRAGRRPHGSRPGRSRTPPARRAGLVRPRHGPPQVRPRGAAPVARALVQPTRLGEGVRIRAPDPVASRASSPPAHASPGVSPTARNLSRARCNSLRASSARPRNRHIRPYRSTAHASPRRSPATWWASTARRSSGPAARGSPRSQWTAARGEQRPAVGAPVGEEGGGALPGVRRAHQKEGLRLKALIREARRDPPQRSRWGLRPPPPRAPRPPPGRRDVRRTRPGRPRRPRPPPRPASARPPPAAPRLSATRKRYTGSPASSATSPATASRNADRSASGTPPTTRSRSGFHSPCRGEVAYVPDESTPKSPRTRTSPPSRGLSAGSCRRRGAWHAHLRR